MTVEQLKNTLKSIKEDINYVESASLGMLLKKVSYSSEKNNISRYDELIVDKFAFTVNPHDTGNSVLVQIVKGEDRFEIISKTYWYNESAYGHNKYTYLNGVWDKSLQEAIRKIREKEINFLLDKYNKIVEKLKKLEEEEKQKLKDFEEMFNDN